MNPQPQTDLHEVLQQSAFLRQLSLALVGSRVQDADDLMQETWIAARENPPKSAGSATGWLARVLRNKAADGYRGQRQRSLREQRAARQEAITPEPGLGGQGIEALELQRRVLEHVLALDASYREVVQLRFYSGLGPTAIAAQLGVPQKTVKSRLTRALQQLRERLDRDTNGDRRLWLSALAPVVAPGAPATTPLLGKLVLMKKSALALAALVILATAGVGTFFALQTTGFRFAGARTNALASLEPGRPQPREAEGPGPEEVPVAAPVRVVESEPVPAVLGSLLVRATHASGQPVAGLGIDARVILPGATRETLLLATTDSQGQARFDSLMPGQVWISTDLQWPRLQALVEPGTEARVELVLAQGNEVLLNAVDGDGNPVANAEVWASPGHAGQGTFRRVGLTDAGGRARFEHVGEQTRLGVRAAGFTPSPLVEVESMASTATGQRSVELILGAPGARLTGTVLTPAGVPVPGTQVLAGVHGGHNVSTPQGIRASFAVPVPTSCSPEGLFQVPGELPPGETPVYVTAPGWPTWSGTVQLVRGETAHLAIELARGGTLVGRVLDRSGEPVAGAHIQIAEQRQGSWFRHTVSPPQTQADAEGRFRIEGIPAGPQTLHARADYTEPNRGRAKLAWECLAGTTMELEVVLDRGLVVAGRAVDLAGAPIRDWSISAMGDMGIPGGVFGGTQVAFGRTDADGQFLLANLPAGPCRLELNPRDYIGHAVVSVPDIAAGTVDLLIKIDRDEVPGAWLQGVIGAPLGGHPGNSKLVLWKEHANTGHYVHLDLGTGRFEHGPLMPGRYRIVLSAGTRQVYSSDWIPLLGDERKNLGQITPGVPGSVVVTLDPPFPADAELPSWYADSSGLASIRFERQGDRFLAEGLSPGRWLLRNRSEPWHIPDTWIEVAAGESIRLQLPLQQGIERDVQLRIEPADDPWKTLTWELHDGAGMLQCGDFDLARNRYPEGPIALHRLCLPAGRYVMSAHTDSGRRVEQDLILEGQTGRREPIEFVLR